ncbi:MAG TPA: copper homeostasis membrane protein CopD [Rhizomicrobium sp.]|nr:copper homeostasis membrane protein CopD [Rhizomicrobium sp.]
MATDTALVIARFLHFASCMILFGTTALCFAVPDARGLLPTSQSVSRLLRWSALLVLLSLVIWFLCVTASMNGDWRGIADLRLLKTVLLQTQFGHVWQWRSIIAIALLIAAFSKSPETRWATLILSLLLLATLALTGHAAMGTGMAGSVHQLADAIHLLAAGFWFGALAALILLMRIPPNASSVQRLMLRFSSLGIAAVVLIAATGLANALFIVPAWPHFLGSSYGRTLLAKVLLVAAMVVFALANRVLHTPRLGSSSRAFPELRRNVAIETALGALVVLAASLLGTLPPPV